MADKSLSEKVEMSLEYLAGLVDGEGYIGIRRCTTKGDRSLIPEFKPTMVVTNTNYRLMEILKSQFSGSICKRKRANETWKDAYSFEFNRTEIRRVLPLIVDKLIIKKEQAKLALAMFDTFHQVVPGRGYTAEELENKERLHKESLALNKRGV